MDYKELILRLIDLLRRIKIPYMFVGGLAADYYGFTRATYDVDVVIGLDERYIRPLATELGTLKFDLQTDDLRMLLKVTNRFMARSPNTDHRIDFWIPKTEFEKKAFERRKKVSLFKKSVWIATPEDVIVMKLLSLRGRDREDIIGILTRQKGKLDRGYLSHWSIALGRKRELKDLIRQAKDYL